jgi:hypothetical protein
MRAAKNKPLFTPNFVRQAMDLPYFYFHDKYTHEYPFIQDVPDDEDTLTASFIDELLYDEFVLSIKTNSKFTDSPKHFVTSTWGVFKRVSQSKIEMALSVSLFKPRAIVHLWKGDIEFGVDTPKGYALTRSKETTDAYNEIGIERGFALFADSSLSQDLDIFAECAVTFIGLLTLHMKYGDKHPVEVAPVNPPKANPVMQRDRPWTGPSGPRVLLLDRMPTTQTQGTGTHASPKPHRRRGHWKTLSHPRFRHHPQYQQKIYVKPSFVGPRQVTYEGNIYRLVQPLEELNV